MIKDKKQFEENDRKEFQGIKTLKMKLTPTESYKE